MDEENSDVGIMAAIILAPILRQGDEFDNDRFFLNNKDQYAKQAVAWALAIKELR